MKNKEKIKVIYAFAASGKTTLCKKYNNFLDLTSSNYQYIFKDNEDLEKRKGTTKIINPSWPQNYYLAIDDAIKKYDIIFIAYPGIKHCKESNISYVRIFPTLDQKDDYILRMKKRGNNDEFIEKKN